MDLNINWNSFRQILLTLDFSLKMLFHASKKMTSWHFWKQPIQEVKALITTKKILEKKLFSRFVIILGMIAPNIAARPIFCQKIGILLALKLTCYSFPIHDGQGLLEWLLKAQVMLSPVYHNERLCRHVERVHNDCASLSN